MYITFSRKIIGFIGLFFLLAACQPGVPVLSSITVEADGWTVLVNKKLYGLTLEEINHAVDGGLYAELVQNRSFEDGVPPLNCPYDASRNMLITPNGWAIPFLRLDSVPGWRRLSTSTYMFLDGKELLNEKNKRSLLVSASASAGQGRGGVVAEGYKGISIRKGEKYQLSLFAKGASMLPKNISIALEDSLALNKVSDVFTIAPVYEWRRYKHVFTANEDLDNAVLTFSVDSSAVFWLDVVSLFPEKTWKNRQNGQREDIMEMVAALNPQFIRFPGGSFAEGYTAGTYPVWRETLGDISERKHFWNVWAYGSTNGMGYHEYLQLCEDLKAEPVYVVNSGVTSQSRRPRFEDITAMDKLVQDALDAIAYANAPVDSVLGSLRAKHGHPEPFNLKYIEIGSENYGSDYTKRFDLFRKAIKETYPEITVISSSFISKKNRGDWVDSHFYAGNEYFIANHDRFGSDRNFRRSQGVFIGEFGTVQSSVAGTLQAAIGEACFMIGAERSPETVKRLAYAPVLGNVNYTRNRPSMIEFDNHRAVATPSYHLWKLFTEYRGDKVLKTNVGTYGKPQVTFGHVAIEMFDNSYEIKNARLNDRRVSEAKILTGGWYVDDGTLIADANRWNYLLMGDSTSYNYEFSAEIRRTKGSGQIQFHLRDNGLSGEQSDYICVTVGSGKSELYHRVGGVRDSLASPKEFAYQNNQWYRVRMVCKDEQIRCYVDDELIHEVVLKPLPSLVALATLDEDKNVLYLKVVNTTQHEERTELNINGLSIKSNAELIQLAGQPEARNTFDYPDLIQPCEKEISFSLGGPMVYDFPPNSITIIKLKID